MKRNKGLQTIQTLAESNETMRSRVVFDQRSALHEEKIRLEQLEEYRNEYQGMNGSAEKGIGIQFMRGRMGFVQRLNEAINNQRQVVVQVSQQLDTHMVHWRDARVKARSLQKFADRMSAQEDQRAARKEQTELDDMGRKTGLKM